MRYVTTIDNQEFEIEIVDERHIRIGERLLETAAHGVERLVHRLQVRRVQALEAD